MRTNAIINLKGLMMISVVFFSSCQKQDGYMPDQSKAQFTLKLKSGSSLLEYDTIKYQNAAGNKFSIHTLNMYVSNISMKTAEGKKFNSNKIFYLDPLVSGKNTFQLDSIPPGKYTEMTFYLGIDPLRNKTLALTPSTDNLNMSWPDMMGGGYHFMKLEGYYLSLTNVKLGFAIHLGKNENLPTIKITKQMDQKYWDHKYNLYFDVNEVFANPYLYNFHVDNNYTMSDSLAMQKIKTNMSDAFTVQQIN